MRFDPEIRGNGIDDTPFCLFVTDLLAFVLSRPCSYTLRSGNLT